MSNATYTNSEEGRNDKGKLTDKGMPYSFPYYIQSTEWLLESGATNHMTACFDILFNVKYDNSTKLHIVNGSSIKIVGYESTYISKHIVVHHVLYVPDYRSNLTCYQLVD